MHHMHEQPNQDTFSCVLSFTQIMVSAWNKKQAHRSAKASARAKVYTAKEDPIDMAWAKANERRRNIAFSAPAGGQ
jgi:hypothetical protein